LLSAAVLLTVETCIPSSVSSREMISMIFLCKGGREAQAEASGPSLAVGAV
jgi:hypothetical protein